MEKQIYTVGAINSYILNMFTQDILLRSVYVKGEVSNVKYHTSGHIYFTLKDESGTLNAVMYAGKRRAGLKFKLEDGQQVVCNGNITAYTGRSQYQICASNIALEGEGDIYEQFEKLKKELEEMGMFSQQYKKPIPKYASKIGIVTASTGDAVHDIIMNSKRRNPYVQLYLYPVTVQGADAPESIVNGLKAMDKFGVDVIIVGRGGGSVEDLFVFNDRRIAETIFNCQTPVVSAVGHEPDFVISDFVADMRAATPTAAAELTVHKISDFDMLISDTKNSLNHAILTRLQNERLKAQKARLLVDKLNPEFIIYNKRMNLMYDGEKLSELMTKIINMKRHRYEILIQQMKGISPLEKLSKGYAFAQVDNKPLKSISEVKENDEVLLYLKDGHIKTRVTEISKAE